MEEQIKDKILKDAIYTALFQDKIIRRQRIIIIITGAFAIIMALFNKMEV